MTSTVKVSTVRLMLYLKICARLIVVRLLLRHALFLENGRKEKKQEGGKEGRQEGRQKGRKEGSK